MVFKTLITVFLLFIATVFPVLGANEVRVLNLIPDVSQTGNFPSDDADPTNVFALDDASRILVELNLSVGKIVLELFPTTAPLTVANFLKYIDAKRYDGSFIHRAVA